MMAPLKVNWAGHTSLKSVGVTLVLIPMTFPATDGAAPQFTVKLAFAETTSLGVSTWTASQNVPETPNCHVVLTVAKPPAPILAVPTWLTAPSLRSQRYVKFPVP